MAIGKGSVSSIPTLKPPIKTTTEKWPTDETNNDEENEIEHEHDHESLEPVPSEDNNNNKPSSVSNFYGAIIAMFTFFLVLLAIIAIYIFVYHGDFLKQLLQRQKNQQKVSLATSSVSVCSSIPIRPPRTKRLSQTLKDIPHDQSNILGIGKNVV